MGLTCMVEYTFGLSQGDPNGEVTVRRGSTVPTFTVFYTTKGDACVCVCVCVCKIGPISARTVSIRLQSARKFCTHSNFPMR